MTDTPKENPAPRPDTRASRSWDFLRSAPKKVAGLFHSSQPRIVDSQPSPDSNISLQNTTSGLESTGPESTHRASVLHTEKPTRAYESDQYLRENEIKFIENMLALHPGVRIVGSFGRGKSTIVEELREHIGQTNEVLFVNCHSFATGLLSTPYAAAHDLARFKAFIETPPHSSATHKVAILDAGDYLKFRASYAHSYGTPEFYTLKSTLEDPARTRQYIQKEMSSNLSLKRDQARRKQQIIDEWNTQFPNHPSIETVPTENEMIESLAQDLRATVIIEQAKADFLILATQAMGQSDIKIILTDHELPMPTKRTILEGAFDKTFASAYRYDLPVNYEVNRARIFLERNRNITDKKLQDTLIAATGGSHQLLKYVVTPEIIDALKEVPEYKRENFLAEVIKKARKY